MIPDESARTIAEQMLEDDEVHQTIISETIESAQAGQVRESGRSLCGDTSNLRDPVSRFPTAVNFPTCPAGQRTAMWHTHPTVEQLRRPTLSIPDVAIVLFDPTVSANIAAGLQESEAFVAPEDRPRAIDGFNRALGINAETIDDVISAIQGGEVADLRRARQDLRMELGGLFLRRPNSYPELSQEVEKMNEVFSPMQAPAAHSTSGELVSACSLYHEPRKCTVADKHRERCTRAKEAISSRFIGDVNVQNTVVSSIIGGVASAAVTRMLFD